MTGWYTSWPTYFGKRLLHILLQIHLWRNIQHMKPILELNKPFSLAASMRLKMTTQPCAPPSVLANKKFFLSMTDSVMLLSKQLLLITSNLPSLSYLGRYNHCFSKQWIVLPKVRLRHSIPVLPVSKRRTESVLHASASGCIALLDCTFSACPQWQRLFLRHF